MALVFIYDAAIFITQAIDMPELGQQISLLLVLLLLQKCSRVTGAGFITLSQQLAVVEHIL